MRRAPKATEPTDRHTVCPACAAPKPRHHYLCRFCWRQLPADTRAALRRTDTLAFRRLSQLLEQLREGRDLNQIEVS